MLSLAGRLNRTPNVNTARIFRAVLPASEKHYPINYSSEGTLEAPADDIYTRGDHASILNIRRADDAKRDHSNRFVHTYRRLSRFLISARFLLLFDSNFCFTS